ncbi:hypothetical protein BESB_030770 [Besnoitia besnoiti]|uniref:Transmembrane protein n=1 Tax=Besnoitia besnoiti TaxID=94643 RepID=A0A2A9M6C8_BESBE|nr:hypothetical protein BESB_030770 [Besnoitia besnoiti]PFH31203.1 hypothetical protein BESB_030770 [Besnoitia besnoiti]
MSLNSSGAPSAGGGSPPSAALGPDSLLPPSQAYPDSLPPLHIICVATHRDGYFTTLLYSSAMLAADIRCFAWGHKWRGFGTKLLATREFAKTVQPGDIVMLVDAFDSVLLQPKEAIARRFLEFGGRIVVMGEATEHRWGFFKHLFLMYHECLFNGEKGINWPKPLPYADPSLNLRLLNAGGIIGFAKDFIRVYENVDYCTNDQRFLTHMFLAEPFKDIVIDYNCAIFALYRKRHDFKVLSFEEAEKQVRHAVPEFPGEKRSERKAAPAPAFMRCALKGVVVDARTNEAPCVLHIHCRRNADWLMKQLGLPAGEHLNAIHSYIWYAIYSLRGTIGVNAKVARRWGSALSATIVTCVGFIGLGLGLLGWGVREAAKRNLLAVLSEQCGPLLVRLLLQVALFLGVTQSDYPETAESPHSLQAARSLFALPANLSLRPFAVAAMGGGALALRGVSWVLETAFLWRYLFLTGAVLGSAVLTGMTVSMVGLHPDERRHEDATEKNLKKKAARMSGTSTTSTREQSPESSSRKDSGCRRRR